MRRFLRGKNGRVLKLHVQGIIPAELTVEFTELAKFKHYVKHGFEKGGVSVALTEAVMLWMQHNTEYQEMLDKATESYL